MLDVKKIVLASLDEYSDSSVSLASKNLREVLAMKITSMAIILFISFKMFDFSNK